MNPCRRLRPLPLLLALPLLAAGEPPAAEPPKPSIPARVELRDGSVLVGELEGMDSIPFGSAYGPLALPVSELKEVVLSAPAGADGEAAPASGEAAAGGADVAVGRGFRIPGRVEPGKFRVKTRYLSAELDRGAIAALRWDRRESPEAGAAGARALTLRGGTVVVMRGAREEWTIETDHGSFKASEEGLQFLERTKSGHRARLGDREVEGRLVGGPFTIDTPAGALTVQAQDIERLAPRIPADGEPIEGGFRVERSAFHAGHAYLVVTHPEGVDWSAAHKAAIRIGGHLAVLTDRAEAEFAATLWEAAGRRPLWIGLTDAEEEGHWEWVTEEPVSFVHWGRGEPNNATDEDAALMAYDGGQWNDARLDAKADGFLLEVE